MARKKYIKKTLTLPDGTRKWVYGKTKKEVEEKLTELRLQMRSGVDLKNHDKANADNHNSVWIDVLKKPEAYWDDLNLTDLPTEVVRKSKTPCDADAGYMNRTNKPKGFHYLNHQCSDADTGIILDVSVTGGDVQDCECCVDRYAYLKNEMHYHETNKTRKEMGDRLSDSRLSPNLP